MPRLRAMPVAQACQDQRVERLSGRSEYAFFFGVLLVIPLMLILLAAISGQGSLLESSVRLAFRPVCHQHADRSFLVFGSVLPVCARCTGFYAGLAISGLISLLAVGFGLGRRAGMAIFVLAVPLAVDGLANLLGIWDTPNIIRAVTGACAAVPLALALMGSRNGNV